MEWRLMMGRTLRLVAFVTGRRVRRLVARLRGSVRHSGDEARAERSARCAFFCTDTSAGHMV